jgi:hypothetical protein
MRAIAILAAFSLALLQETEAQESPAQPALDTELSGHVDVLLAHEARPEDRSYFEDLAKDRRAVIISVRSATDAQARAITGSYRGSLKQEQVQSLVQFVLANDSDFWNGKYPIQLSISGDLRRIAVMRYWWKGPLESSARWRAPVECGSIRGAVPPGVTYTTVAAGSAN